MDYYFEIQVVQNAELSSTNVLLNKAYELMHRDGFKDVSEGKIGISLPESSQGTKTSLGTILRVHGTEVKMAVLRDRMTRNRRLMQLAKISDVLPVPANTKYRIVSRIRTRSVQAYIRHRLKRGKIQEEDIDAIRANYKARDVSHLPFLSFKSQSNEGTPQIFIQHGEIRETPSVMSDFSGLGFSHTSTIPWF